MPIDPYTQARALVDAAVAAIATLDYATALKNAYGAQALLAIIPDMTRSPSGGGSQEMTWMRQTVNDLIVNLRRQHAASVGVQVVDNTYYGELGQT
jgi:hypothetical protein